MAEENPLNWELESNLLLIFMDRKLDAKKRLEQ